MEAVRAGAHREQAAQAAGIARSTLQAWLARTAWLIERRHPSRWGRRTSHELSGPEGGPIEVADKLDLRRPFQKTITARPRRPPASMTR